MGCIIIGWKINYELEMDEKEWEAMAVIRERKEREKKAQKPIKELVSGLIYDRYKYQDPEFYGWKKASEMFTYIEEFCVDFFFEYKRYLFIEKKTDSDFVFYKFCADIENEKILSLESDKYTPPDYYHNLSQSISQFIYNVEYMLWNIFEYYEDEKKVVPEEERVQKFLEIIFDRLNDLRKRKDIR